MNKHIQVDSNTRIDLRSSDFGDVIRIFGGVGAIYTKPRVFNEPILLNRTWQHTTADKVFQAGFDWQGNGVVLQVVRGESAFRRTEKYKGVNNTTTITTITTPDAVNAATVFDGRYFYINNAAGSGSTFILRQRDPDTLVWSTVPLVVNDLSAMSAVVPNTIIDVLDSNSRGFRFSKDGSKAQAVALVTVTTGAGSTTVSLRDRRIKLLITKLGEGSYEARLTLETDEYGTGTFFDHTSDTFTTVDPRLFNSDSTYSATMRFLLGVDYQVNGTLVMGRYTQEVIYVKNWSATFTTAGPTRTDVYYERITATNYFEWMESSNDGASWAVTQRIDFPSATGPISSSGGTWVTSGTPTGSGSVGAFTGMAVHRFMGEPPYVTDSATGIVASAGVVAGMPHFLYIDPRSKLLIASVIKQTMTAPTMSFVSGSGLFFNIIGVMQLDYSTTAYFKDAVIPIHTDQRFKTITNTETQPHPFNMIGVHSLVHAQTHGSISGSVGSLGGTPYDTTRVMSGTFVGSDFLNKALYTGGGAVSGSNMAAAFERIGQWTDNDGEAGIIVPDDYIDYSYADYNYTMAFNITNKVNSVGGYTTLHEVSEFLPARPPNFVLLIS